MLDAIELQVRHGRPARGLRGDGRRADPLGALLEHQGAPRRLDRRCSTPTGRWSCRPSTSPCTSARCRRRSRRCSASATRPASRGSSTTPSPAAPTCPTSPSSPRLRAAASELIGFAASRAHHADVGGRVPGSMPADSRSLQEEGVVISPAPARRGLDRGARRADAPAPRSAAPTCAPSWPPTAPGALRLDGARRAPRPPTACARRPTRCSTTASGARAPAWRAMPDGTARARRTCSRRRTATSRLRLRAAWTGDRLMLDFSGSAPQHEGNLNCPLAVTRSACLFAVRVLTDPDIPPTAGAYRPVERDSAPRAACSTPAPARRWRPATSRPPRAWPTSC